MYIYSLLTFTANNQETLHTISAVYSINTRNKYHYHTPVANLTHFQKNYHAVITICKNSPCRVKCEVWKGSISSCM